MKFEIEAPLCKRCHQRPPAVGGKSVQLCDLCRNADKNRHYNRDNKECIIVHVDSEGLGDGELLCLSFGREDGSSGTIHTESAVEALNWLFDNVTGLYNGETKQVIAAFHFNYDSAILAKFTDTRHLQIVHKSGKHYGPLTPLCNERHCLGECGRVHRQDQGLARNIITQGGEGDLLAWDKESTYALATTPNRRFYVEKRPNGDRFDGRVTLDVHDHGKAFVGGLEKVIEVWRPEITDEMASAIKWGKAARKTHFQGATPKQIGDYSEAECVAAARCSRKLIDTIKTELGITIKPHELYGAGSIAQASFQYYGVPTRKDSQRDRMELAIECYFGGIIETPIVGMFMCSADEVDLNSAYPAHMRHLPCMRAGHGHWQTKQRFRGGGVTNKTVGYVRVTWDVRTPSTPPFSIRVVNGCVRQPLFCLEAWVTIPEYLAALKQFGSDINAKRAVFWKQDCDCPNPLAWMEDFYHRRQEIKAQMKQVPKGSDEWHWLNCVQEAIKLVINSGYGKFAQQRPTPGKYSNLHYAAMITGATRAKVRTETWAQEARGGIVLYQHTDSVISVGGNPVDGGKALGEWGLEDKETINPFLIQPGLMMSEGEGKSATRGVKVEEFRKAAKEWEQIVDLTEHPSKWPPMTITTTRMISRRLAHKVLKKPEMAGVFMTKTLDVRVSPFKRNLFKAEQIPGQPTAWLMPPILIEKNQATLLDILKHKKSLALLIEQGEYDDDSY